MEQLVQRAVALVFGLEAPVVYSLVGFLTWAEAAFFLGLVTPGEIAMAVGGALASRGQVAVEGVAAAAAVGTVTGNLTGYLLGRRWGARLLEWAPLRRVLGRSIDAARAFFTRRGAWAVVLGQFVSYVRIFIPFLAGASGMSSRRYVAYGLPTGAVWAVAWVVGGFALGESWRLLQDVAGPASFLVLALFLLALVLRWAAARIARHRDRVQAMVRWVGMRLGFPRLRRLLRRQRSWLGRRFEPGVAYGLSLTVAFVVLLVGVGTAGIVLSQVAQVRGVARLDFPALEWMAATRTEAAVLVARTGLLAFVVPGFLGPTLLLTLYAWWRSDWRAGVLVAVGMLGSGLGAHLLDERVLYSLVPRAGFPSVPVAVAASVAVHLTGLVGARDAWGRAVAAGAVGVFLVCTVALAALVAGWAAPSGLALGLAVGLTWSTSVEVTGRYP